MWICIAAALIIEGSWVFLCVVMKLKDVLLKSIYLICWECVAELVPDLFGSYAVFFLDICQSWILIFWSVCAACSSVWSENTEDTYRHKWYSLFFFTERFHRGKEHENDSVQLRQQSFFYIDQDWSVPVTRNWWSGFHSLCRLGLLSLRWMKDERAERKLRAGSWRWRFDAMSLCVCASGWWGVTDGL